MHTLSKKAIPLMRLTMMKINTKDNLTRKVDEVLDGTNACIDETTEALCSS